MVIKKMFALAGLVALLGTFAYGIYIYERQRNIEIHSYTGKPEEQEVVIPEIKFDPLCVKVKGEPNPSSELTKIVKEEPEKVVEYENQPVYDVVTEQLELLACVIYQEAGGDQFDDDCRRMVADVVLNRIESPEFPNTMEEVLTEYRQYGKYYWTGVVWPQRASESKEAHAVERAYRIAREVLLGQHSSLYGNGYIWQAEFEQGTDVIYCCGTYFGR